MNTNTRNPVRKTMCETCPWRDDSPYVRLRHMLSFKSQHEGRTCHSTGESAIYGETGKEPLICRGSRNEQLERFWRLGFITAATDKAWDEKCRELGLL